MKHLANSFAELAAIIMILITLAISTAVVTQWPESGPGQQSAAVADLARE